MTSVVSESHVVFLMLLATVALAGCTFLPHLPPPTPTPSLSALWKCSFLGSLGNWRQGRGGCGAASTPSISLELEPHLPDPPQVISLMVQQPSGSIPS